MKMYMKIFAFSMVSLAVLVVAMSAQAKTERIEKVFSVGKGGTLIIDSDVGSIEVETWDKGEVAVSVKKRASSQKRLDRFEVLIKQRGDDIYIEGDNERFNRIHVEFDVRVPREYNVDLNSSGGSIDVDDINGKVELHTSGGSIKVGDVQGRVKVGTSGGSISIANVAGGDVDAHTSGGSIKVGDVDGDLDVNTSGGSIHIGEIAGVSSIHTSGGSITLTQGGMDVKAHTSGGSINIGPSNGKIEVNTSGGGINIDMAGGDVNARTSGGSIKVEGSKGKININTSGGGLFVGSSEGPVNAHTSGGSIKIMNAKGAIDANTSGGSIEAQMIETDNTRDTHVNLNTSGGSLTIYLPETIAATVSAKLKISRFAHRDYQIFSDFPLSIGGEESRRITAKGDINGGGDMILLNTSDGDIHIRKVE